MESGLAVEPVEADYDDDMGAMEDGGEESEPIDMLPRFAGAGLMDVIDDEEKEEMNMMNRIDEQFHRPAPAEGPMNQDVFVEFPQEQPEFDGWGRSENVMPESELDALTLKQSTDR